MVVIIGLGGYAKKFYAQSYFVRAIVYSCGKNK
jgi:hypothetical protein